ncbi:hypothetical protein Gpo141_00004288 [Globisporangium polare]
MSRGRRKRGGAQDQDANSGRQNGRSNRATANEQHAQQHVAEEDLGVLQCKVERRYSKIDPAYGQENRRTYLEQRDADQVRAAHEGELWARPCVGRMCDAMCPQFA